MIRRTLKSGLLATVAVFAFLPTAAGASPAGATPQHPVPSAVARYDTHHHRTHHRSHRGSHHRRVTYRLRHDHRYGTRGHRFAAQGSAYRSFERAMAYRLAPHTMPYRLRHRSAAQSVIRRRLPVTGRVATRYAGLNVRSGPGTGYRVVGHRAARRTLALTCRTRGSSVYGDRTWYRLARHGGYVSARYVRASRALPWC